MKKTLLLQTLPRLGLINLVRVALYRLSTRLGKGPLAAPIASGDMPSPVFFKPVQGDSELRPARSGWVQHREQFGLLGDAVGQRPPQWHTSVLSGCAADASKSWFQLPDFDPQVGDIKGVWEASRFDWVIALAQHAANDSVELLERLNAWLEDWWQQNPPYKGPNWKCGQEASIRVMHLLMAARILDQVEAPQPALRWAIQVHLERIAPTLAYALAQDNNHGTSEAAALFIGGTWLKQAGVSGGEGYSRLGRKWLENRARRLIMQDGSFSQYSVNYHRVMLDTYTWAELWRRVVGEPPFTDELYRKLKLATDWLANMVMSDQGDAPNLGANDGARLIPLTDTDYRDFRPSVQLASTVFHQAAAYEEPGDYDLPLRWLNLEKPQVVRDVRASKDYAAGGFAVLRNQRAAVLFRYPVFKFRPSQCDLLHVDLWVDSVNVLRDAGTYSYNSGDNWQDYFGSTAAHNTVQFDGRDQMPKLSRFLYGAWPKLRHKQPLAAVDGALHCEAAFKDWQGAEHRRAVTLEARRLVVMDRIKGFKSHAVLRWRLAPGEWKLTSEGVQGPRGVLIQVKAADGVVPELRLAEGRESRYYSQMEPLPVLEVTVDKACTLISEIHF